MKRIFAFIICAVMCFSIFSCADGADGGTVNTAADSSADTDSVSTDGAESGESTAEDAAETDEEEVTAEDAYSEYEAVKYDGMVITHNNTESIANGNYTVSKSDGGEFSQKTYTTIISSCEEWSEISSSVGLEYEESFFDESSLVVVEVYGASSTDIEGMTHIVIKDSSIVPVVQINEVRGGTSTADEVYWYVTAEVSKADIEGYELGELEVEWNITGANEGAAVTEENTDGEASSKIVYCESGDGISASLSLDDEDVSAVSGVSDGGVLVLVVLETPADMPEMDKSSLNINSTDEEVDAARAAYREAVKEAISAVTSPFVSEYGISESAAGYTSYIAKYSPMVQLTFESADDFAECEDWIISFAGYEAVITVYIEA
ncbi:MAG: hypothetical protein LUH54_03670 [Firmicutes bacterium]|nr:hypothetical protein [Bacillota bacterium]